MNSIFYNLIIMMKSIDDNITWRSIQQSAELILRDAFDEFSHIVYKPFLNQPALNCPAIYSIKNRNGNIIYIGQEVIHCIKMSKRSYGSTGTSILKRKIGLIMGFKLVLKNGKTRYLSLNDERQVDVYLQNCMIGVMPVQFGLMETESYLKNKYNPVLNLTVEELSKIDDKKLLEMLNS